MGANGELSVTIDYPESLPVSARRHDIAAAIRAHQVVVIAGETGSGKTTQLPKICLELGYGTAGVIGHTQPRRIAARSVAERIATELNTPLGELVGYKVRFNDLLSNRSRIKLMTDGILLAELQQDRWLRRYEVLIIDEAHERSLNIDFLLGVLKQLLARRRDLKLIITSATINTARFSAFFNQAPIIEVSGRCYPVEILYRPPTGEEGDLPTAVLEAVHELTRLDPLGDILVFLAGERDIREVGELLAKANLRQTETLPLYSRLSIRDQDRIFRSHTGRRIVLATNVAETSLTVPGIRFVIDSGLARISRYSHRTGVQRLPIEAISQASANQRSGRCGRVAAGVAIRLYSEEDFNGRDPFPTPEIQRVNLASVMLQMALLRLGKIEQFAFIDPPEGRAIREGYQLLYELGAIDEQRRLSAIGRQLAQLPVDPRLGRLLIAAAKEGALQEGVVLAAALSLPDLRERPADKQQQADQAHQPFNDSRSDFITLLNLWAYLNEQQQIVSQNQLRKLCRQSFLNWLRWREWRDIVRQLTEQARQLNWIFNRQPADYGAIHRSLLTGLLAHIGYKDRSEAEGESPKEGKKRGKRPQERYLGGKGMRFDIFPGSGVSQRADWIVAAELVETSRRFGRTVAAIEVEWLEPLAGHLVKRSYADPHWERRRGRVSAWEQVTLNGLIIVARRRVDYGPVDPELAREIFIRQALVEGDFETTEPFLAANRSLVAEIEQLEAKARRRDILVDAATLYQFYDQRLPAQVRDSRSFHSWYAKQADPERLYLQREDVQQQLPSDIHLYPDQLQLDGCQLRLTYHFDPSHKADGVTAIVPLPLLTQLTLEPFEWLVPGMLYERLVALLKSLPKALRRNFVPTTDFARALQQRLEFGRQPLLAAMSHELQRMTGVEVPPEAFRPERVSDHLQFNFQLQNERNRVVAESRDLIALQRAYGPQARQQLQQQFNPTTEGVAASARLPAQPCRYQSWQIGEIAEVEQRQQHGIHYQAWPALVDCGDGVELQRFDNRHQAAEAHRQGVWRLLRLTEAQRFKGVAKSLQQPLQQACLLYAPLGSCQQLTEQLWLATLHHLITQSQHPLPRSATAFERLQSELAPRLHETAAAMVHAVVAALQQQQQCRKLLKKALPPSYLEQLTDMEQQLQGLIYPDFISHTPPQWLPRLAIYLQGMALRYEKMGQNLAREREAQRQIEQLSRQCSRSWLRRSSVARGRGQRSWLSFVGG